MMSNVWRIFVVEGEEALNRSLVTSLRKDGFVVHGVTNGADAVRVLWTEEYDVAICDLETPGADGFELLRWLRAYRPNTHVVAIGVGGFPELRMQVLECGAESFLEKPLDIRVLKEELRRLLQQTGFSASLDSFDLLDVIQMINMSRKSITLLVNTGLEERGILHFHNGELIWAEYGLLRAEEAFFALAAHKNGTVIHQPWAEQVVANVTQPLSRLIFQALQYRTKYANMSQVSGEHEVVSAPVFSAEDIDDSPFMVLPQEEEDVQVALPQQVQEDARLVAASYEAPKMDGTDDVREWWERTGQITSVHPSPNRADGRETFTPNENVAIVPGFDEYTLTGDSSPAVQKTPPTQRTDLPSWLTDQPTASNLPVMRPPAAPTMPRVPVTPVLTPSSPEWQVPPSAPLKTTDRLATNPALVPQEEFSDLSTGISGQRATGLTGAMPAPVIQDWQPSGQIELPGQVEQIGRMGQDGQIMQTGYTGQMAPLDSGVHNVPPATRDDNPIAFDDTPESNPRMSTVALKAQRAAKRNYVALVAALQTLGHSIHGFVAAAVVSIEGQPIAQIAIDDLDISKMCKPFSMMLRDGLLALELGGWGHCEHLIVSSGQRRILLRMLGDESIAFQVLITTPDADAVECLEVMANVEGAISAALR